MSPTRLSRLLAGLLLGLALCTSCAHAELRQREPLPASLDEPLLPEEREIANLIDEYRARRGLPALRIDPALCRAARRHAVDMARTGRMVHRLNGVGPAGRAEVAGYRGAVAENLASGSGTTPRGYFDLWIGSAAHRANLLRFREGALGVGFAGTPAGDEQYLAALFGDR